MVKGTFGKFPKKIKSPHFKEKKSFEITKIFDLRILADFLAFFSIAIFI
jgi:hypothetical protein